MRDVKMSVASKSLGAADGKHHIATDIELIVTIDPVYPIVSDNCSGVSIPGAL